MAHDFGDCITLLNPRSQSGLSESSECIDEGAYLVKGDVLPCEVGMDSSGEWFISLLARSENCAEPSVTA